MRTVHAALLGLLIVTSGAPTVLAQSTEDVTKQFWCDVNPSYYLNPHRKIYGDIGVRWEAENDGWWRLVVRPSFKTRIHGRFKFTAGVGNFITFNEIIENRYELRPFQGLEFDWPRWKIPLYHYFRLEERFDFNTGSWNSKNSLRLRYKISASYKWAGIQPQRFWRATAGAEMFATLAGTQGQFQEKMRVTLGIDRSLRRDLHYRFEVTWQKQSVFFLSDASVSDIYLRFRLTKSFGKQKA